MTVEKTDKRLVFVPLEKAAAPIDGLVRCMANRWWVYDKERGLVFWRPANSKNAFPLCNSRQDVIEDMIARDYRWATALFVPTTFEKADPRDYV